MKMSEGFDIGDFISDNDIRAVIRYLAAYREVEGDLGTLDELRRIRSLENLADIMCKLVRVKDRVISKLIGEPEKYEVFVEGNRSKLFNVSETNLEKVYEYAKMNAPLTGKLLSSFAFASEIVRKKEG
ncbi:MAG: hypothetical protein QXV82_09810 [Ignisphaera sp.]